MPFLHLWGNPSDPRGPRDEALATIIAGVIAAWSESLGYGSRFPPGSTGVRPGRGFQGALPLQLVSILKLETIKDQCLVPVFFFSTKLFLETVGPVVVETEGSGILSWWLLFWLLFPVALRLDPGVWLGSPLPRAEKGRADLAPQSWSFCTMTYVVSSKDCAKNILKFILNHRWI